ncbi:hypothetical protein KN400_3495 [Geobacter sulfurreducens KN400]|nr:hypothetical protein KN400_3495 [Geobacter sulfurreducens KN400]
MAHSPCFASNYKLLCQLRPHDAWPAQHPPPLSPLRLHRQDNLRSRQPWLPGFGPGFSVYFQKLDTYQCVEDCGRIGMPIAEQGKHDH